MPADLPFANDFLRGRIRGHRKDVEICMRGQPKVPGSKTLTHAYFPAFMITIGFGEMLAGLHAGKLEGLGLDRLQQYFRDFMDPVRYSKDALNVLYEGFRHKVAHVGHPYGVFDTSRRSGSFKPPHRRYAWTFYASPRTPPLELIIRSPAKITSHATPWDVHYDSEIKVSVRSLSKDLVGSVFKANGYFDRLQSDPAALSRFATCMEEFFPR